MYKTREECYHIAILSCMGSLIGMKIMMQVPPLISEYEAGRLKLDQYITHRFNGVEGTLDAIHALHSGECLRAVVTY